MVNPRASAASPQLRRQHLLGTDPTIARTTQLRPGAAGQRVGLGEQVALEIVGRPVNLRTSERAAPPP